MVKTFVHKLKKEFLHNGSRGESSLSSPRSHHLPGAYSICNEAIDRRSQKCNKLRSSLVAISKGRSPSTQKLFYGEKVVRKLKLKNIQQNK
jgi:hypothetical protein